MREVKRYVFEFARFISDKVVSRHKKRLSEVVIKIENRLPVNFFSIKDRAIKIAKANIIRNKASELNYFVQLYLDYGVGHFMRTLSDGNLLLKIDSKEYEISNEECNNGANYFNWFNLYVATVLLGDENRMNEIFIIIANGQRHMQTKVKPFLWELKKVKISKCERLPN